ncbi:2-hydroxyacid dehydrogenase [Halohasta litorea]|uniref:2-hydroxyacid dehydrogenase n=1 Tax=Halohasta litorea TaxID=869891 RepID=A0ABD6D4F7_9EURY|nr:2-hydroxyacid dehydrogenase [Halohasta litorea]
MNALITANFDPAVVATLRDELGFDVEYAPISERDGRLPDDEFRQRLDGVEVLIVGYEGVSESVLADADDLEIIACPRGGPDANVDIEAATDHGIPVLYTPGRNAVSVGDFTWGQILSLCRNIAHSHHLLHTGTYTGEPQADAAGGGSREDVTWGMGTDSPYTQLKGTELAGKTVGLVGMGAVAREVATRAQGFEVDLLSFDPYIDAETMADYGAQKVDLDELLDESDIVSVHVPVTDSTRGLLGPAEFERMKDDAFFINNARGAIIDQEALVAQLQSGGLGGAALDVYDQEPIPDDHPLLELDNVVTTPHLGGATEEVISRHSAMIRDDLEALFEGEEPQHVANEAVLSSFSPPEQ